jgi:aspartate racemase
MKTLGLIGGTTWLSTIEYYRLLNEGVSARTGDVHTARCIIHSFDFADILEINKRQDWDACLELVAAAALNLKRSGAEGIVLCANTLHVVAERLEPRVGLPIIHVVDAVAAEIRRVGLERVSLLGTRFTMELPFFKDRLNWHGIGAIIPEPGDREFIHQSIFAELGKNVFRDETRARYLSIIASLDKQGARGSILGCTEIPLLIKQTDTTIPVFDTTALHARAAVDFALS